MQECLQFSIPAQFGFIYRPQAVGPGGRVMGVQSFEEDGKIQDVPDILAQFTPDVLNGLRGENDSVLAGDALN